MFKDRFLYFRYWRRRACGFKARDAVLAHRCSVVDAGREVQAVARGEDVVAVACVEGDAAAEAEEHLMVWVGVPVVTDGRGVGPGLRLE